MAAKTIVAMLLIALLLPGTVFSREVSLYGPNRYEGYETSTGAYEEYEVVPGRGDPFVQWQDRPGTNGRASARGLPRSRLFAEDAHGNVPFYTRWRCAPCHREQAEDVHTVRAGLACTQCHTGMPVRSVNQYFSPLNPIRRHAYVCAKCHQGAGASFASYVIHEPSPGKAETAETFPALFWVFWIMVGVFALTFVLFLPLTLLWVARDFFAGKRREKETQ